MDLRQFAQPSVMNHDFSRVPQCDIPRSTFMRPFGHTTTIKAGYIYPVMVDEILPGDTFNVNLSAVARMTTPLYPIMDNQKVDFHFFFVPYRLVWENFERFMGAQDDPDDSTDYVVPQISSSTGFVEESLYDYLGLPIGVASINVNSLILRGYNLIWNTWYRDQNLQDSVEVYKTDSGDSISDYTLLKRNKSHDYFTSALPWPLKGGDEVLLPLVGNAEVITGSERTWTATEDSMLMYTRTAGAHPTGVRFMGIKTTGALSAYGTNTESEYSEMVPSNLYADLGTLQANTINSIREAFQLQRLLERDARCGTRYVEILKGHFGVTSPDFRLQRPEFLGSGSRQITVSPVPDTNGSSQLGDLGATGQMNASGINITKSFVEHGCLYCLMSVKTDLRYQQGLDKMWSRQTKYDFYWPGLAFLGESEIYNKEIYCDGSANDDLVFGYQERWSEYRYKNSLITSQMRSTHSTPLDAWHLAQEFASLPTLDSDFIEEDPPMTRVLSVTDEMHYKVDLYFQLRCTRPMPLYSVPGLIDHF